MSTKRNCQQWQEMIAALVLGDIGEREEEQLRAHLKTCDDCRKLYESMLAEEEQITAAFDALADQTESIEKKLLHRIEREPKYVHFSSKAIRRIRKFAIAAVILIGAGLALQMLIPSDENGAKKTNRLMLLQSAFAAERAVFEWPGVVHIVNEIVVYPVPDVPDEKLKSLNAGEDCEYYFNTVHEFLEQAWIPICSIDPNGGYRFHQLSLKKNLENRYTVTDESYYENETGRFARLLQLEEKTLFANSFDGSTIYTIESDADGVLHKIAGNVGADFTPPVDPSQIFGISAGVENELEEDVFDPIQDMWKETLDDGTNVTVYQLGYKDLFGDLRAYWLFRVRDDNNRFAEMEFVIGGYTQILIRSRIRETLEAPKVAWDLHDVEADLKNGSTEDANSGPVSVSPDMFVEDVSLEYIVERADFEAYFLNHKPAWCVELMHSDILDVSSPPKRMYVSILIAKDGRDVIMCQSSTFNQFFANILQGNCRYELENGNKVWGGGPEKWWTELHFRSCGIPPKEDRCGYVFETPSGTYVSFAINGPVTDEELKAIGESLVSGKSLIENEE